LRRLRTLALLLTGALPLAGCNLVLLNPAGDVALQERNVLIASTALMLLIIVPVMALIALFAWRYRRSNTQAAYAPDWHHSTALEVAIWAAPLTIIVALGALTWTSTHVLDPYRPISRTAPGHAVTAAVKPLRIEAVALDWKWLFIYPDLGIATVNEAAAPVDQPLAFDLTSSSMMNTFDVPALAGMVYTMPGMKTELHAVFNRPGVYTGMSGNYTGRGFSDMHYPFHAMSQADFDRWVAKVKSSGGALEQGSYLQLAKPSEREPVRYYASVQPDLFNRVVNECVAPGQMCVADAMRMDAAGGREETPAQSRADEAAGTHGRQEGQMAPGSTPAPPSRTRPANSESTPNKPTQGPAKQDTGVAPL
jgi:cytochrome o ubiquinol oxidase subunit II